MSAHGTSSGVLRPAAGRRGLRREARPGNCTRRSVEAGGRRVSARWGGSGRCSAAPVRGSRAGARPARCVLHAATARVRGGKCCALLVMCCARGGACPARRRVCHARARFARHAAGQARRVARHKTRAGSTGDPGRWPARLHRGRLTQDPRRSTAATSRRPAVPPVCGPPSGQGGSGEGPGMHEGSSGVSD